MNKLWLVPFYSASFLHNTSFCASSITRINQLLKDDYQGIIVTMTHKFRDMPANLNLRSSIYILIDEAYCTTGGNLGNFLMAGLPNMTFLGFTSTPVDKTAYGKGRFKTVGCENEQSCLHKYSIADTLIDWKEDDKPVLRTAA